MPITLTTGVLVTINGSVAENDVSGFVTGFNVDFINNVILIFLSQGTVSGSVATIGNYGTSVEVKVNMTTGAWTSGNAKSGTIVGAGFTNLVNQLKADRNLMETFAAGASGIMPGSQVSW